MNTHLEDSLKPRLAIRVGVTGHRLNALQKAEYNEAQLRESIRRILAQVKDTAHRLLALNADIYRNELPLMRVVSPLAEGSDRLVATEALALGYELQCPIPLHLEDYVKDFKTQDSENDFCNLLQQASSTFELNGDREECAQAYKAAGHIVIRQSDILLAIWDGQPAKGPGGTAQIIRDALSLKTPVVWIESSPPHTPRLLIEVSESGKASRRAELIPQGDSKTERYPLLEKHIGEILSLPSEKEIFSLQQFYREKWRRSRFSLAYRIFCKVFVWDWKMPDLRRPEPHRDEATEWLSPWKDVRDPNKAVGSWLVQKFRPAFYRADQMADVLADRFRSFFLATYVFGASAVLAAFIGAYPMTEEGHGLHGFFWLELFLIAAILVAVILNNQFHWHRRWIEYRLLAEGLRQMVALAPFARVTPSFEVPVHIGADTGPTWYNWYFRALVRQAGMVSAFVHEDLTQHCQAALLNAVDQQIKYHKEKHEQEGTLHHRLHHLSFALFFVTLVACIAHLVPQAASLFEPYTDFILTFFALVFPAAGYAVQGILYQGEFGRVSHRSKGIENKLRELRERVSEKNSLQFQELGKEAEIFSMIQLQEQTDWRAVFIMKEVGV